MTALPELDGVHFRTFRDASDYPDLARLITASARGEGDDRVETTEAIASGYDHLERCDPVRDLLVAEVRRRFPELAAHFDAVVLEAYAEPPTEPGKSYQAYRLVRPLTPAAGPT